MPVVQASRRLLDPGVPMSMTTILIIVIIFILLGGGFYWRGRR